MRKFILAAAAGFAMTGAAFADHHEASDEAGAPEPAMMEPVAQLGDCKLFAESPGMPDPKTATAEDRSATVDKIKAYQAALSLKLMRARRRWMNSIGPSNSKPTWSKTGRNSARNTTRRINRPRLYFSA